MEKLSRFLWESFVYSRLHLLSQWARVLTCAAGPAPLDERHAPRDTRSAQEQKEERRANKTESKRNLSQRSVTIWPSGSNKKIPKGSSKSRESKNTWKSPKNRWKKKNAREHKSSTQIFNHGGLKSKRNLYHCFSISIREKEIISIEVFPVPCLQLTSKSTSARTLVDDGRDFLAHILRRVVPGPWLWSQGGVQSLKLWLVWMTLVALRTRSREQRVGG